MAMTVFLLLNGMGVAFLLYVLANFWNEGRRGKRDGREYQRDFLHRDGPAVFVLTRPLSRISRNAADSRAVIPLEFQEGEVRGKRPVGQSSDMAEVISMKRFSTR